MPPRRKAQSRSRPRRRTSVRSKSRSNSRRVQSRSRRAPPKRSRSKSRRKQSARSKSQPFFQPVRSLSPVRVVPPAPPLPPVPRSPSANVSDAAMKQIRVHVRDYVYENQRAGLPIVLKEMIDLLEDVISANPATARVSLSALKQIVTSELARLQIKAR